MKPRRYVCSNCGKTQIVSLPEQDNETYITCVHCHHERKLNIRAFINNNGLLIHTLFIGYEKDEITQTRQDKQPKVQIEKSLNDNQNDPTPKANLQLALF